jgi:hypothetical protein
LKLEELGVVGTFLRSTKEVYQIKYRKIVSKRTQLFMEGNPPLLSIIKM